MKTRELTMAEKNVVEKLAEALTAENFALWRSPLSSTIVECDACESFVRAVLDNVVARGYTEDDAVTFLSYALEFTYSENMCAGTFLMMSLWSVATSSLCHSVFDGIDLHVEHAGRTSLNSALRTFAQQLSNDLARRHFLELLGVRVQGESR